MLLDWLLALSGAALFLVIVAVFVIILIILLRKLQKLQELQKEQAFQLQAVHQQQASFTHSPSVRAPAPSPYMAAQPVAIPKPVSPAQEPAAPVRTPPVPSLPVQGVQVTMQQKGSLDNHPWLALVEDDIAIYDELDRHMESFDAQSQQLAEHVLLRLEEVLERSGVNLIQGETAFDRHRHQPMPASTGVAPGAPILETLRPGFAVDGRVLRRARVRA